MEVKRTEVTTHLLTCVSSSPYKLLFVHTTFGVLNGTTRGGTHVGGPCRWDGCRPWTSVCEEEEPECGRRRIVVDGVGHDYTLHV